MVQGPKRPITHFFAMKKWRLFSFHMMLTLTISYTRFIGIYFLQIKIFYHSKFYEGIPVCTKAHILPTCLRYIRFLGHSHN